MEPAHFTPAGAPFTTFARRVAGNKRRPDNWTSTKPDASCAFLIKLIIGHVNATTDTSR